MKNNIEILNKAVQGKRITSDEALILFQSKDILSIGETADLIRIKKHTDNIVTFVIDRNINYTNICISKCKFCAFHRDKNSSDAYLLSKKELLNKIEELKNLGGTQILMQGGLHPDLKIDYYTDLLKTIKSNFNIHIHSFSPPEIIHFTHINNLSIKDVLIELKNAGLDTIPGGGAEILCDEVRKQISPNKCTSDEWLSVMKEAHKLNMRTTATMMFGHIESYNHRVEHLDKIRKLQDETGGFTAFIPWTFQPGNTQLPLNPVGGFEYLKTLSISRIFLDNFDNIQASWVTQGAKIAQVALRFGANDLGSTMLEENVVKSAGISFRISIEEMKKIISDADFKPVQRDCYYNIIN